MLKHRIIPILLWDGKTAVQTTKFSGVRPVGSMEQHIEVMESRNIDELIILDIAATREKREPNFELIKRYAGKMFCPVTYGGGISSLDHTKKLIQECGVDKIALRRNFFKIGDKIANQFGSQSVIYAFDIPWRNVIFEHILLRNAIKHGAGEILLTSVERNGTQIGYNIHLMYDHKNYKIPIILNGGCGSPEDMIEAVINGANAVAASSMFLFTEHTPRSCARKLREAGLPVRVDG